MTEGFLRALEEGSVDSWFRPEAAQCFHEHKGRLVVGAATALVRSAGYSNRKFREMRERYGPFVEHWWSTSSRLTPMLTALGALPQVSSKGCEMFISELLVFTRCALPAPINPKGELLLELLEVWTKDPSKPPPWISTADTGGPWDPVTDFVDCFARARHSPNQAGWMVLHGKQLELWFQWKAGYLGVTPAAQECCHALRQLFPSLEEAARQAASVLLPSPGDE